MTERKRGLGRGLSALMADMNEETEGPRSDTTRTLPIELIHANPEQPRRQFNDDALTELVNSVREKGVIQPLIVRELSADNFQIVAGERRWRAAQKAGLHELPVVVRSFTDTEVLEIAIIENIQRENLNAIDEAGAYRQLMEQFGHSQEQVAKVVGKSRSHISNTMRLMMLPEPVLTHVREGRLSSGHARALITSDDPEALSRDVIEKGLSVRETERLAREGQPLRRQAKPAKPKAEKDADTAALEGDLSAALGMGVQIYHEPGGNTGTIKIRYDSLDQLDEICRRISGY